MGQASIYRHKSWALAKKHWSFATTCLAPRCLCPDGRDIVPGHRLWGRDVGHIVSVRDALTLGWTVEQINAVTNTRSEHSRCNRHAGAKVGGRVRSRATPQTRRSRAW